ncbi:PD40 domain-containing protein [Aquimarina sp. AU474]|uniref:PD40 domain-containing protein n=1 Tax=Aquimarina sp. AU474 TaxID=2108529 RepID=UPI000D68A642|nr:PD40 domain-containing protein [Aquimarina sp. AU474]
MKITVILSLCLLFISCKQKMKAPDTAQIFGEGKISTEAPEFASTLNAQENVVFFNRTSADRSTMKIMYSLYDGKHWSAAKDLPFSNGQYRDVDPFVTPDGNRLYFSSTRPVGTHKKEGVYNTWYVKKTRDGWSKPINPGSPFNSDSTDIFVTMTTTGNAYFVSEREKRGIVRSEYKKGSYQSSKSIELKLNGKSIYASNPCISYDETFLIVAARDPEGNGSPDLFVSWNNNGAWSELINLGLQVNSEYADFAPSLSKDQKTLFFTSERPGIIPKQEKNVRPPGDIYYVNIEPILNTLK